MTDSNDNDLEELFGELRSTYCSPQKECVRKRSLEQSLRVVRQQRQRRHWRGFVSHLAVYAAGLVTMAFLINSPTDPKSQSHLLTVVDTSAETPVQVRQKETPITAHERARLEGDQKLREGDIENAVRHYTEVLKHSEETEFQSTANDTWLLAALKVARNREVIMYQTQ